MSHYTLGDKDRRKEILDPDRESFTSHSYKLNMKAIPVGFG